MVADPTPIARRESFAVFQEDGWVACGACGYRLAFRMVGTDEESRQKCPNDKCRRWVRFGRPRSERVSRRL